MYPPRANLTIGSVLVFTVALAGALPARAGGLYGNEFGTPEMGTAGAGAEASALDASTAIPFYNPAGMTRLEGNQLIVAGGAIFPSVEFDLDPATTFTGGDGGQAGGTVPILTAAYVHGFTDRFKFGVAMFAAAGAGLEYDPDWAGRKQSQTANIAAVSLSPTVAYRLTDWLSIGGGLNIMAGLLETEVEGLIGGSQIRIDGTDTQVSFNLSALIELDPRARVGLSYVSKTEFDFAGDVSRMPGDLTAPVNTTLTLPQAVRVGVHWDVTDRTALVGTVGWEDWSALENQFVSVGEAGTATLPRNWEDTYRLGFGVHHRVGDAWLLRFGANYDDSPTRSRDRTVDLPVDEQIRVAAGFQNERSDRFGWGAELTYAELGDAEIDSTFSVPARRLVGKYRSNEYLAAAFHLQWRF